MNMGPKNLQKKVTGIGPSYESLLMMVSNALKSISPDIIKRSFTACGVAPFGQRVQIEHLNGRLRGVLGFKEGIEDLSDNDPMSSSDEDEEVSDTELDLQE